MHICFLTSEYPKIGFAHGGVGTFVKMIAQQLTKTGVKVSVVGVNYSAEDEHVVEDGISIYRVKKNKVKGLSWYLNFRAINKCLQKIHHETPIDIVETSEFGFAFIKKDSAIKYLIRLNGGHHFFAKSENRGINLWKGLQEKRSFGNADAFIAVSEYVGTETQRSLRFPFEFETIYNSVDTNKFELTKADKVIGNTLLFVGTICEKKGVRQLVMAMPEIVKNCPDVKLKIVGRDWFFPDGKSYVDYLKTFISDDISNAIEIVGAVDHHEIAKLLDETEICVFPSHMEAMPFAWLEALSKGKPFVGSDIGPGREAITDNQTGLLADPLNPDNIAEKVLWMLNHKQEAHAMGLRAREMMVTKFNTELIFQQNIDFYKRLISK